MTREEFIRSKAEGERFGKRIPWWIFACMWVAGVGWTVYLVILLFLYWSTEACSPILINKQGEAVLRAGKCGDCGTKIMEEPNQASEATSESALGTASSSPRG